jgi:hypothetical protein
LLDAVEIDPRPALRPRRVHSIDTGSDLLDTNFRHVSAPLK